MPPSSAVERAVRGWLNHLEVERGVSTNTLSSYRRDLARYAAYLDGRGVGEPAEVTEAHVSDFLATLREGSPEHPPLAASSAARTLVAVRGFHRFLALEGDVPTDPAAAVSPPRAPARLPKAIGIDEVERLLAAAGVGDTPASLRDRALLEVLYGVGARISEAVGLDIDDIDAQEGVVRLFGKGSKERLVPLGSYAAQALDAYLVRGRPVLAAKGKGTRGGVPQPAGEPAVTAVGLGGHAHGRRAGQPRRATCPRTPCGTPSPRTCSTAAPTSGSSRSCWATRR